MVGVLPAAALLGVVVPTRIPAVVVHASVRYRAQCLTATMTIEKERTPIYPLPYNSDDDGKTETSVIHPLGKNHTTVSYRISAKWSWLRDLDHVTTVCGRSEVMAVKQTVSGRDWQRRELSWLIYWLLHLLQVLQEAVPMKEGKKKKHSAPCDQSTKLYLFMELAIPMLEYPITSATVMLSYFVSLNLIHVWFRILQAP